MKLLPLSFWSSLKTTDATLSREGLVRLVHGSWPSWILVFCLYYIWLLGYVDVVKTENSARYRLVYYTLQEILHQLSVGAVTVYLRWSVKVLRLTLPSFMTPWPLISCERQIGDRYAHIIIEQVWESYMTSQLAPGCLQPFGLRLWHVALGRLERMRRYCLVGALPSTELPTSKSVWNDDGSISTTINCAGKLCTVYQVSAWMNWAKHRCLAATRKYYRQSCTLGLSFISIGFKIMILCPWPWGVSRLFILDYVCIQWCQRMYPPSKGTDYCPHTAPQRYHFSCCRIPTIMSLYIETNSHISILRHWACLWSHFQLCGRIDEAECIGLDYWRLTLISFPMMAAVSIVIVQSMQWQRQRLGTPSLKQMSGQQLATLLFQFPYLVCRWRVVNEWEYIVVLRNLVP